MDDIRDSSSLYDDIDSIFSLSFVAHEVYYYGVDEDTNSDYIKNYKTININY